MYVGSGNEETLVVVWSQGDGADALLCFLPAPRTPTANGSTSTLRCKATCEGCGASTKLPEACPR